MKHNTLTLGSLFSGSGAFELAGLLAGIQPIWSSEVAPFPNGGDLEAVDIITFGSP